MGDKSPTKLNKSNLRAVVDESNQKPVKNVVAKLEKADNSPKSPQANISLKNNSNLTKENAGVNNLSKLGGNSEVKSPLSGAKLKNTESVKIRKKVALLKKKNNDEVIPKSNSDDKSPKCVNKEKVSREKVAKLAKKFEQGTPNPSIYDRVFKMFRKSEFNYDDDDPNSPVNNVKSPSNKVTPPLNGAESPSKIKFDEPGMPVTMDGGYLNNYREGGLRAREAELNRQKKILQSKGLLTDTGAYEGPELNRKFASKVMLKKASRRIPQAVLNRPKSEEVPSFFGSYPVLVSTSCIILFVFLSEIIFNKISFNGRCVSKVLYPHYKLDKKPYQVVFGYGACEHNLQTKAEDIGFLGKVTDDKGWPTDLVSDDDVVESTASFDSPNYRVFNLFGSLDANYIRNYNEHFRLFWSMFMHSGLFHMLFNLVAQTQILWIIEPDWGFTRTMATFLISGFVGNLSAAVFEPSFNVVGSSGCMFGLIASLIPYCIENWTLLASPIYIFIFSVVITIISLCVFNNTVSLYSHFGGWIGGFLWGFATLRRTFLLKDCAIKESILLSRVFRGKLTPESRTKLKQSYQTKLRKCVNKIRVDKREKKFVQKVKGFYMYPVEYFKRGPFDILIRVVPLTILVVFIVVLCCYLFVESLYSKVLLFNEASKLSQCCYLTSKGESPFTKRVFWCFEDFQTAKNFCKV